MNRPHNIKLIGAEINNYSNKKSSFMELFLFAQLLNRCKHDGNASTILRKRVMRLDKKKGRENKEAKMSLTKTQDVLFGKAFKRADRAGQNHKS